MSGAARRRTGGPLRGLPVALRDGRLYDWGPPEDVVTERLLADVFGVEADVRHEPELQIFPRRALGDERS